MRYALEMIGNQYYTYRHDPVVTSHESLRRLMIPDWIYEQKVMNENVILLLKPFFYSNLIGHFINLPDNEIFM